MSVLKKPDNELTAHRGNANADLYVMGHGDTVMAMVTDTAVGATEAYVVVDLSDDTNFPHTETGKIRLYSLTVTTEKKTDGDFILYIGVVIQVNATDGSVDWFMPPIYLETVDNPTDDTDRWRAQFSWPGGLDLEVSGGAMVNVLTATKDAGDVLWQDDTPLTSPKAGGSAPGAGDLVAKLVRTAGTMSFGILAEYTTEA